MAEILLYGSIYSFTAEEIVSKLDSMMDEPEITLRISSGGGDVFAGYSILAKLQEYKGKLIVKVDGWAASMAAFMLLFSSDSESLDVSSIMFHRADMYVYTPEDQAWLDGVNATMRKKMEQKIPSELFATVTGKSYSEMFDPKTRIDITLTAKQAKKLGLIKRITTLDVAAAKQIESVYSSLAAHAPELPESIAALITAAPEPIKPSKPIQSIMNIAELRAAHPAIVAEVERTAAEIAVTAERDRVGAFMAFIDVDPTAVKAGIEAGKPLSQTEMASFARKAMTADALKTVEAATTTETPTAEVTPQATAEATAVSKFLAESNADRVSK